MTRLNRGFTLIELMVVISIIALLIILFVPQIPALMTWYRVHASEVIMRQIETGVEEYNRIYGDYPPCSVTIESGGKVSVTEYWKTSGFHSIYVMLQGPDATGWGPTAADPAIKEFGPIPESPGFVGKTLSSELPHFQDPFGRPILYNKAVLDSPYDDISSSPYCTQLRYNNMVNRNAWQDGMAQRGGNETQFGGSYFYMGQTGSQGANFVLHWRKKLTVSIVGSACYPYNEKSYILWLAGGDARFGYWTWSEEHGEYIVDEDPDDNGSNDGVIGICDDITNF